MKMHNLYFKIKHNAIESCKVYTTNMTMSERFVLHSSPSTFRIKIGSIVPLKNIKINGRIAFKHQRCVRLHERFRSNQHAICHIVEEMAAIETKYPYQIELVYNSDADEYNRQVSQVIKYHDRRPNNEEPVNKINEFINESESTTANLRSNKMNVSMVNSENNKIEDSDHQSEKMESCKKDDELKKIWHKFRIPEAGPKNSNVRSDVIEIKEEIRLNKSLHSNGNSRHNSNCNLNDQLKNLECKKNLHKFHKISENFGSIVDNCTLAERDKYENVKCSVHSQYNTTNILILSSKMNKISTLKDTQENIVCRDKHDLEKEEHKFSTSKFHYFSNSKEKLETSVNKDGDFNNRSHKYGASKINCNSNDKLEIITVKESDQLRKAGCFGRKSTKRTRDGRKKNESGTNWYRVSYYPDASEPIIYSVNVTKRIQSVCVLDLNGNGQGKNR